MQPNATRPRIADERGATIVLVAVSIATLIGCAAIAVDLGMLLNSRGEAQRVADAAALAGASVFAPPVVSADQQVSVATTRAREFAGYNTIFGTAVMPAETQVDVDPARGRVTATVRRRGIPTWFARIFRINEAEVGARAVAAAQESGTASCLKPFLIPDAYLERVVLDTKFPLRYDNPRRPTACKLGDTDCDYYDPIATGYGSSFRNPGQPGDDKLGYINDVGRPIVIKAGNKDQGVQPGWYFPIVLTDNGGKAYEEAIANQCTDDLRQLSIGETVSTEPGNMVGPTKKGITTLTAADPTAKWVGGKVTGSRYPLGCSGATCTGEGSPRIVVVPLFNPDQPIPNGRSTRTIVNFGSFFIEDYVNKDDGIVARWLGVHGKADDCRERGTCRPNLLHLRLVPVE